MEGTDQAAAIRAALGPLAGPAERVAALAALESLVAALPMPDDDPRWEAMLDYTTDDDGVWLGSVDGERVLLGFNASVREVLDAAKRLRVG